MTFVDTYLTLVPRGLHFTVQEMLLQQLCSSSSEAHDGTTALLDSYHADITILGDDYTHHLPPPPRQQPAAHVAGDDGDGADGRDDDGGGDDEEQRYVQHLAQKFQAKCSAGKGQSHKRRRQDDVIPFTCILPVGTTVDESTIAYDSDTASSSSPQEHPQRQPREVSIGYINDGEQTQAIWSQAGHLPGLVWIQINTNAPPVVVASIRCIAPLLSLVHFQEFSSSSSSNSRRHGSSSSNHGSAAIPTRSTTGNHGNDENDDAPRSAMSDVDETKSLDHVVQRLKEMVSSPQFDMTDALDLWTRHVRDCWNDSTTSNSVQHGHDLSSSEPQNGANEKKATNASKKKKKLTYRLSCMRPDSRLYSYTRQELLTEVADFLVPPPPPPPPEAAGDYDDSGDHDDDDDDDVWNVDLKHYDLEIVLLMRAQFVAVGLSLRPYPRLGTACFGAGKCPPDVAPPYLTGGEMSGLVRLRPSTAQVLLHLANVQMGDILLDPCAGIGTIPMEAMFLSRRRRSIQRPALALGGDLVLGPNSDTLKSIAATYEIEARRAAAADLAYSETTTTSTAENLLAWDASHLPIRSGSVDVIVSDLPFGQKCLSSKKLSQLLPILLTELARVLRPGSGRVVLLCGYYLPILEELRRANEDSSANDTSTASHTNDDTTADSATTPSSPAPSATSALPPVWTIPCQAVFPVNIGGHLAWVIQVMRGMGTASRISHQVERVRKLAHTRNRNAQCKAMNDNVNDTSNDANTNKTHNHSKASKKNRL